MPHDHREEARQWLARAQGSLVLARQPKPESAFWADLCYLAQQSAEKALKAVYYWIDRPHRFTHDLEELGRGLMEHGLDVPLEGGTPSHLRGTQLRHATPARPNLLRKRTTAGDLSWPKV